MDSLNPDYEAMASWLALQSDNVKNNSEIIDTDVAGQDFMLHIDKNTPEVFTPRMPPSADHREDATAARITVSPNLIGCYIGYQRGLDDFLEHGVIDPEDGDPYRGGYDICELKFQHCLKVNRTLVPDADCSLEHWLVAYSEASREYRPIPVGKIFVSTIAQKAVSGKTPAMFVTFLIQVTKPEGFKFSPSIHLTPGFYKAEVLWSTGVMNANVENNFTVKAVQEEEFMTRKRLSAALLSHQEPAKPAFSRW